MSLLICLHYIFTTMVNFIQINKDYDKNQPTEIFKRDEGSNCSNCNFRDSIETRKKDLITTNRRLGTRLNPCTKVWDHMQFTLGFGDVHEIDFE